VRVFSFTWGGVPRRRLYELIINQSNCIQEQRAHIAWLELQHARGTRDLVDHFLLALDEDEEMVRDGLTSGLADLKDHVARLEEHAS
jgi:hypothetical protein